METVNVPLNVCKSTFLQPVDPVVFQVQLPQRCGILECSGGDVTNVVVIEIKIDEPLEVIKDSVIHNTNIIEAQINGLQGFKAVEAVS